MKIPRKLFQFFVFYLKFASAIDNSLNRTNEEKCENKVSKYFLQRLDPYTNTTITLSFFQNFNTFTDLYMNCNQMYNTTAVVQFRPNKKLLVDETLFFGKLINSSHLALLETLVFSNTKGVDLNSKIIKKNISHLVFVYSEFNIYSNGTLLSECTRLLLTSIS